MDLTCQRCGEGFFQTTGRPGKYCLDCRVEFIKPARYKGGVDRYGREHQLLRAYTIDAAYGTKCARCGKVMEYGQKLNLDHDDNDPTKYLGYSHESCNKAARKEREPKYEPSLEAFPEITSGKRKGRREVSIPYRCWKCGEWWDSQEAVLLDGEWVGVGMTHSPEDWHPKHWERDTVERMARHWKVDLDQIEVLKVEIIEKTETWKYRGKFYQDTYAANGSFVTAIVGGEEHTATWNGSREPELSFWILTAEDVA